MASLLGEEEFIQKVCVAIGQSLDIESVIVGIDLKRIAGTLDEKFVISSEGIIKKIFDTGQSYIVEHPKEDIKCHECPKRQMCNEKAFIHCPIFLDDKVVGVMGLMCFNDVQREKLVMKKDSLLSFIQSMCELISSKLRQHELNEKLERQNIMLNQLLNIFSEGYILLNNDNKITNINKYALRILGLSEDKVIGESVDKIIYELDSQNIISNKDFSFYDEININGRVHGVFLNPMKNKNSTVGAALNFKKVDKISSRVYGKAFQTKQITFEEILEHSKKIMEAKELAQIVSETNTNILLLGESGTGKELFARAIHNSSDRNMNHFIPVNCAAIPRELLESELFGYEGGAFTGANKSGKPGKFELANKGTIFLDEIGDMPFYLQAKILRVLQEKTIEKVGGVTQHNIDVRIIAATNRDLEKLVREGDFREDLYYRLNVIPVNIPPLRQRDGDIRLLINYFLEKYSDAFNTVHKKISLDLMRVLESYEWPGNIRELENIVQYLVAVSTSNIIDISVLPEKFLKKKNTNINNRFCSDAVDIIPLEELQKRMILKALKVFGESTEGKLRAAKHLGISKTTLYRKLSEYKEN